MESVAFITLTNNGYRELTLNCLKSLDNIGFEKKLHCYTIGEEFHNELVSKGYKSTLFKTDKDSDKIYHRHLCANWESITKRKFDIIHKELLKNKYVCFTDGDIVYFKKKFMQYCLDNIEDNDLLIQNDSVLRDDNDHSNLCTGFMFIKSSDLTQHLFNPKVVYEKVNKDWNDQIHVNEYILNKIKYKVLPLDLFPNGGKYLRVMDHQPEVRKTFDPLMAHFNYVLGSFRKINHMKRLGKWYLDN